MSREQLRVYEEESKATRFNQFICNVYVDMFNPFLSQWKDCMYAEPAISDDLITKHNISLNTFFFDKLCLRLCFKLNIYFFLKHLFHP